MKTPYLEMKNISKQFPGVLALNKVDFSVSQGEVVGLVGENGAGKSTLMKIISGVHKKDEGEVFINGNLVNIQGPLDAQQRGISTIYQELNTISNINIAENIFIGRERRKGFLVDRVKMHREAKELIKVVGLNVSTETLLKDLSIAQRQMVEVAKALSMNAKVIIMDEPTSSLTETETKILLEIIKKLKEQNVGIVFISHRLNEVFKVADRISILRDGKLVGNLTHDEMSEGQVVTLMVGREIKEMFGKEETDIGHNVLEVKSLSTKDFLNNINFSLKKGEILGFAGLVGAGRSEVMRAIFGIDQKEGGQIYINNERVEINSPKDAIKLGIGYVPEDRKEQALILHMTMRENITLPSLKDISRLYVIDKEQEKKVSKKYVAELDIKASSIEQRAVKLSGGNQQKVVISKWLQTNPKILILDEPTRGIDVGAKKEIHSLMGRLVKRGVSIIMISSELPEILGMSDRIVVMHKGEIKGEVSRQEASQEKIMEIAIS